MSSISKSRAKEIAREECERRGIPWREPISVKWGFLAYTIWGGGRKGGNLMVRVRKCDGAVISATMSPM